MGLLLCSSSYVKLIRNNSDKMKNKLDQLGKARANRTLGRDNNLCVDTEIRAAERRVPGRPAAATDTKRPAPRDRRTAAPLPSPRYWPDSSSGVQSGRPHRAEQQTGALIGPGYGSEPRHSPSRSGRIGSAGGLSGAAAEAARMKPTVMRPGPERRQRAAPGRLPAPI